MISVTDRDKIKKLSEFLMERLCIHNDWRFNIQDGGIYTKIIFKKDFNYIEMNIIENNLIFVLSDSKEIKSIPSSNILEKTHQEVLNYIVEYFYM